jgi:hypothetical protein
MKASITEDGVLIVTPETPLETFALRQWGLVAVIPPDETPPEDETMTLVRGKYLLVAGIPPTA